MAGIGFTLRRVLAGRSLSHMLRAYGAGATVSSGPWALSILALALIGLCARRQLGRSQLDLFFAAVTNVYAFSLILTGPLQLIVTRYIADLIYLGQRQRIIPSLLAALSLTGFGLAAIALPLLPRLGLAPLVWIGLLALFAAVGGIWITMLFISATRRYDRIVHAFLLGSTASVAAAAWGSARFGLPGLVWGYTGGQALLLYALITIIALEFPRGRGMAFDFLGHFKKHPRLALIGFCYNLAIWADKLLFWHHPATGLGVAGFLHTAPVYDLPAYLAYLSIIPGMAFFTVRIETALAESYHGYFDRVLGRGSLAQIRAAKQEMAAILGSGARRMLHIQGVVCLTLLVAAPLLVAWLRLDWVQLPVFRLHLVGVLPLGLVIIAITVLYYLDAQRSALILSATFLAANVACTAATLVLGPTWYGFGAVTALTVAAATGLVLANREIRDLEFHTFTRQPLRAAGDEEAGAGSPGSAAVNRTASAA